MHAGSTRTTSGEAAGAGHAVRGEAPRRPGVTGLKSEAPSADPCLTRFSFTPENPMPSRRAFRRFLRKSRGPVAYVLLLATTLALFLFSAHSCALQEAPRPPEESRAIDPTR